MTPPHRSDVVIRPANEADARSIVSIVREMGDGASPVSEDSVREALGRPGFGILVAEGPDGVVGVLSYSIRPNLWHAAEACLIEILAVRPDTRGEGIGGALMEAILDVASSRDCVEITVMVDPANVGAQRLYRRYGLAEEVVGLERHF